MIKLKRNDADEGSINEMGISDITRNGSGVYIGMMFSDGDTQAGYKEEYSSKKKAKKRVRELLFIANGG